MKEVYDNAMFVAQHLGWTMINCGTKDGKRMRNIESIHQEIYQKIQELYK